MDIFLVLALLSFIALIIAWMALPHSAPSTETQTTMIGEAQPLKS